jgi:hypothetical protein
MRRALQLLALVAAGAVLAQNASGPSPGESISPGYIAGADAGLHNVRASGTVSTNTIQSIGTNLDLGTTADTWKGGSTTSGRLSCAGTSCNFTGGLQINGSSTLGAGSNNYWTIGGSGNGSPAALTVVGLVDPNVDANVVPKGTGSLEVASREVPVIGNTASGPIMICYGEEAVSTGVVTITFASEGCEAFGGTPVCLCGNTSNTTENSCSTTAESTTQVTLNGTGSETYSWFCIGARP